MDKFATFGGRHSEHWAKKELAWFSSVFTSEGLDPAVLENHKETISQHYSALQNLFTLSANEMVNSFLDKLLEEERISRIFLQSRIQCSLLFSYTSV